jgi:type II secretion system protein D
LGAGASRLEREVAVVAEPDSNSLLISASPRYFEQLEKMVEELDQAAPQVLIQVLLAEVSLEEDLSLGFQWQSFFGSPSARSVARMPVNFFSNTTGGPGVVDGTTMALTVGVTTTDFLLLLRALETQGRLQVLSRPQILASDNQKAEISVGENVPFIRNIRVSDTGSTFSNVEYEKIGIILRVTPQINPEGFVNMQIHPEISSRTDSNIQIGEGVTAPVFRQRSADTTISIKDGQTIVIGGLISDSDEKVERKVPGLGDMPLIGALFRNVESSTVRRELLIILTPRVLTNMEQARRVSLEEHRRLERLTTPLGARKLVDLTTPPSKEEEPEPRIEIIKENVFQEEQPKENKK